MTEIETEQVADAKDMLGRRGISFNQEIADQSAKQRGRYELRNILYSHYLAAGHDNVTAFYMSEN